MQGILQIGFNRKHFPGACFTPLALREFQL